MSTLTDWIAGDPLRNRPGWYDVRDIYDIRYRFWWTGRFWRHHKGSRKRIYVGAEWDDTFRGLSAPAKD